MRPLRILTNRNIIDRLHTVAPFFSYDTDPYIIIDDNGRLKWIVDAYTTTNNFPYSQSFDGFNYIRNSVKAVIDAYDGDVTFYITDEADPIAKCYSNVYPNLFSKNELPKGIKEHIKYPELMFDIQAKVYGKYHTQNPTTFYNKNDIWTVAKERYGTAKEEKEIEVTAEVSSDTKWVCPLCGYVHTGTDAPKACPACLHDQAYFEVNAKNY